MTSSTTRFRALTALLPLLAASLLLTAKPAHAQAPTANLEVRILLGSNNGSSVDGALRALAGELRSRFGYSSFQQLGMQRITMTSGASRTVRLPNGQSMTITFQGMAGSGYRLSVSLPGGGGTVTAPAGSRFFVAGPPHQGGTIIVSIVP